MKYSHPQIFSFVVQWCSCKAIFCWFRTTKRRWFWKNENMLIAIGYCQISFRIFQRKPHITSLVHSKLCFFFFIKHVLSCLYRSHREETIKALSFERFEIIYQHGTERTIYTCAYSEKMIQNFMISTKNVSFFRPMTFFRMFWFFCRQKSEKILCKVVLECPWIDLWSSGTIRSEQECSAGLDMVQ